MKPDVIIQGCDVLVFEGSRARVALRRDISVAGSRIVSIESTGQTPPEGARVIPAEGLLAVPGMLNTHAHVPMVLFRGVAEDVTLESWFNEFIFPMESNLTPEDVYWGALLGMAEMIEAGITFVADHYFFMDEVARAVSEAGLRANLCWAVFEHEGLEKLTETAGFIQRWQGGAAGRITTWMGPHSPYLCGPDFLAACARQAAELDVGVHLHVSETAEQVRLARETYGRTPVEILEDAGILDRPAILAHCLYPTEADLDCIARHGAGVARAPKTYLRAGMGFSALGGFQDRGIPVGLASDGAASSSTLDLLEQMRLMALMGKYLAEDARAMPLDTVLQIAFPGSARAAAQPDLGELAPGELAPGKLADIVFLRQDRAAALPRLNPLANLVYVLGAADVDTVICDGRVLMAERELLTLDKARIRQEVNARLARLTQRVPGKKVAVYPA